MKVTKLLFTTKTTLSGLFARIVPSPQIFPPLGIYRWGTLGAPLPENPCWETRYEQQAAHKSSTGDCCGRYGGIFPLSVSSERSNGWHITLWRYKYLLVFEFTFPTSIFSFCYCRICPHLHSLLNLCSRKLHSCPLRGLDVEERCRGAGSTTRASVGSRL